VNSNQAIVNGAFANKPLFFGSSTAEIASLPGASNASGWNGDSTHHVYNAFSWFRRGGHANEGSNSGAFATSNANGSADTTSYYGHRTILSGY
jgi:hypothetical protein